MIGNIAGILVGLYAYGLWVIAAHDAHDKGIRLKTALRHNLTYPVIVFTVTYAAVRRRLEK